MKQSKISPTLESLNNDNLHYPDKKFTSWQLASPNHPVNCQKFGASFCAIKREQKRQRHHSHVWIIHPSSQIRFNKFIND